MAHRAGGPLPVVPGAGRGRRAVDGRRAGLGLARAAGAALPALGEAEPDGGDGGGGGAGGRGGRAGGGAGRADPGQRRLSRSRWPARRRQPGPGRANAELARSKAAVQARYDLAVEAIRTFHTGVSEDFLLKQDQFKELRDRLLKSAADFYGKLGALLGKETDLASRRALAQANFEVAELTGKVGRKEDALAAHRRGAGGARGAGGRAGGRRRGEADVGRSLTAVARLLEATGKTDEAVATYREAEALLAGPAGGPTRAARAALAACRSRLGWLLLETGHDRRRAWRSTAWPGPTRRRWPRPRGDERGPARPGGHDQPDRRPAVGDGQAGGGGGRVPQGAGDPPEAGRRQPRRHRIPQPPGASATTTSASCCRRRAEPAEAEAEYRKALAIQQKLADDNPAVTEFRSGLAHSHNNLGILLCETGKPAEAEAEYRKALAIYRKLADDNPAVTDFRSRPGEQPQQPRHPAVGRRAGRRRRRPSSAQALAIYQKLADDNPAVTDFRDRLADSHNNLGDPAGETGRAVGGGGRVPRGDRRSSRSWPTTTPPSPSSAAAWRTATTPRPPAAGGPARRRRRPSSASRPWRSRKLADDNPAVPTSHGGLATTWTKLASAHLHGPDGRRADAAEPRPWRCYKRAGRGRQRLNGASRLAGRGNASGPGRGAAGRRRRDRSFRELRAALDVFQAMPAVASPSSPSSKRAATPCWRRRPARPARGSRPPLARLEAEAAMLLRGLRAWVIATQSGTATSEPSIRSGAGLTSGSRAGPGDAGRSVRRAAEGTGPYYQ